MVIRGPGGTRHSASCRLGDGAPGPTRGSMALYRFPFPSEKDASTWTVRGTWDNGGHEVGQSNNPTDEQAYAYDIGHATGGKVLAARAGEVIDLDEQWADDTHPADGTPGPGNYIWIRHGDGTMGAYCHLKSNSVRVSIGQYALQGSWIAESDNTGQSGGPHLHFDVHTYGERGLLSAPDLGTQLLIHFEDKARTFFRPAKGEALSGKSNNVEGEYRQDNWRFCGKCHALYFATIPGSVCPEGGGHEYGGGGNYTLAVVGGVEPPGQKDWRYCSKCHALFFAPSSTSRCPVSPGAAHAAWGDSYALPNNVPEAPGHQSGWRWCRNCAVLWFPTAGSRCPATGNAHSSSGSGNYRLHHTAEDWQRQWRFCSKCSGLFFGQNVAQSKCAGNAGGPHVIYSDPSYNKNYFLALDSPDAPGQGGWRWCNRCQGLWMGLNEGSACPAGKGGHSKVGSGEYWIIHNAETDGPGQKQWRWCSKCQGLHRGGAVSGTGKACAAGGDHATAGSGKYRVQYDGYN